MCPIDKAVHSISVDRLPCCYAILSNLPHSPSRSKEVCCPKHPKKKIKFQCRVHTVYLCSNCIIDHTGAGHDVVAFSITYAEMRREAETLVAAVQKLCAEAREAAQAKALRERRMSAFYQSQIQKVANTFDAAIRKLTCKKSEFIDTLTRHQRDQQKTLDQHKAKLTKALDSALKLTDELRTLSEHLEDKSYDEFYRILSVKKQEAKLLGDFRLRSEPEPVQMTYREGNLLGSLGGLVEVKPDLKEEDEGWTCTRCAILNHASRETCEACSAPALRTIEAFQEDWKCRNCAYANPRSSPVCYRCKAPRSYDLGTSQGAETARYGYSPSDKTLRDEKGKPAKAAVSRNKVAPGRKRTFCKKRNNSF